MHKENFEYKTFCELAITSTFYTLEIITKQLGIKPERTHHKGEEYVSKHSGSVVTRYNNLWAIKSKEIINNNEEKISSHIEFFRSILYSKKNVLKQYKEDKYTEVSFWIWIETDNAGIGIDLEEDELIFINDISNRVHLSFLTK